MNKISRALLLVLISLSLVACTTRQAKVIRSLGKYQSKEFYSAGDFQDYTDYAKYTFETPNISDNDYFSIIQEEDIATLNEYIDNFEEWIKATDPAEDVVVNYDFDRALIDTEDYFYIYDRESEANAKSPYKKFESYNVYFLDTQTNILYYFHSNI